MAFFNWETRYSVGIEKLDKEHKKLVKLLNDLYTALQEGRGRNALGDLLAELISYTQTHFASEEGLLKAYGYPDFEAHQAKHHRMKTKVQALHQDFTAGKIANPVEISTFLKDWLKKHIQGTDMRYSSFLKGKGVR